MARPAITCGPDDGLDEAARRMWESDCGVLLVLNGLGDRRVVGMITDRDVCMAAYTRGQPLSLLRVRDAMSKFVHSCRAGDPVDRALEVMAEAQVRRLPVVDRDNRLVGVVSLADVARALYGRPEARTPLARRVVRTLAAISTSPAQAPDS